MRAFIGVMMAMGLLKNPTMESYWNKGESFLLHASIGRHTQGPLPFPPTCTLSSSFVSIPLSSPLISDSGSTASSKSPSTSRNRFQNILRFLHCNDNTQAAPRGSPEYDPGYKIRPVVDILNNTFDRKYNLGRDLTVDESMVGFKL
jgi:hypothetical protein